MGSTTSAKALSNGASACGTHEERASGLGSAHLLKPEGRIIVVTTALVLLSVIVIASAETAGGGESAFAQVVMRRLLLAGFGAVALIGGYLTPYHFWRKSSNILLALAMLSLILVLVPSIGTTIGGSRRWIRLAPGIGVQPSEFVKIVLLIWLAAWCHNCHEQAEDTLGIFYHGLLIPGTAIGMAVFFMLLEPDFGTAALTALASLAVLLVSGASVIQAGLCFLAATPIIHLLIVNSPYRLQRITTFLNPLQDIRGSGYQLVQSLAAIASGGIYGMGPGEGGVAYLPAASNDFIFSVIARQFGFIGALLVMAAFGWLLWEGTRVALRASDKFGFSLAFGITFLLCAQAAIHIAVTTASAPTTGITMPLVSAGGSSLIFSLWGIGILCNISKNSKKMRNTP